MASSMFNTVWGILQYLSGYQSKRAPGEAQHDGCTIGLLNELSIRVSYMAAWLQGPCIKDAREEQAILNAIYLNLGYEAQKDPRKRYSNIDLSVSAPFGHRTVEWQRRGCCL